MLMNFKLYPACVTAKTEPVIFLCVCSLYQEKALELGMIFTFQKQKRERKKGRIFNRGHMWHTKPEIFTVLAIVETLLLSLLLYP